MTTDNGESPSTSRKILLFDSDLDFLREIEDLLRREGFEPFSSNSPRQALELAVENRPQVALIEADIPDQSGLRLLEALISRLPECSCIMTAAQVDVDAALGLLEGGAQHFLRKPFTSERLLEMLDAIFERSDVREQSEKARKRLQEHRDQLEKVVRERTSELQEANDALQAQNRELASTQIALRSSEAKYRLLTENATDAIWTSDLGMSLTYISPSIERMTGYSAAEAMRLSMNQFYVEESAQEVIRVLSEEIASERDPSSDPNRTRTLRLKLMHKDGPPIWTETIVSFLRDRSGRAISVQGVTRNIEERKAAEDSLRDSEANYRALLERLPDPVMVHDQGVLLFVNQATIDTIGYSRDELVGTNLRELIHPDDLARFQERQVLIDAGEQPPMQEIRGIHKNGLSVFFEAHVYTGIYGGASVRVVVGRDVTERNKERRALEESERKFREVVNSIPESVIETNQEMQVTFANLNLQKQFGYTEEELLNGFTTARFVAPEDRDRAREDIQRIVKGEVLGANEYTMIRKDDSRFPGIVNSTPVYRDGEPVGMRSVIVDVTEQKASQEAVKTLNEELEKRVQERTAALAESESQVRLLLDSTAEAIFGLDLDGRCTFCNPACLRLLGFEGERDLLGNNMHDLVHYRRADGTHYPNIECKIFLAFRNGEGTHVDDEVLWRANGSSFPAEYWSYPIRREGKIIGSVVTFVDITERRQIEDALKSSEERYRDLVERSPDVVWRMNRNGEFTFISPTYKSMTGFEPHEIVGSGLDALRSKIFAGASSEDAMALLSKRLRGETGVEEVVYELTLYRKDGTEFPAELRSVPVLDDKGEIAEIHGIARDITERREAEAEKDLLEDQLRQTQKMEAVGRLAGGIAHDFNNLLTAISGYSEMILNDLKPDDPMSQDVREIRNAGERAAALTRQLLTFSRKQVLQPRILDLNAVVENMESMLRRLIGENITLVAAKDTALGRVKVDPGQMEQVIMNLVINARDAIGRTGEIRIETANARVENELGISGAPIEAGDYVVLSVQDDGCGMDDEVMSKIFEPFYTTKEEGKGTGLGLATVFGIIEQSGGAIRLESSAGDGTTFFIYLPEVQDVERSGEKEALASAPSGGKETILLVEDEDLIRGLAERTLTKLGYEVLSASQGGNALLIAERHEGPIHLMVTDVVMPQMSGMDLAERLDPIRPDMKVLYISGYSEEIVEGHMVVEEGMNFLAKPFLPDDLARAVRRVLSGVAL